MLMPRKIEKRLNPFQIYDFADYINSGKYSENASEAKRLTEKMISLARK